MGEKKAKDEYVEQVRKVSSALSKNPNYSFLTGFCQIKGEVRAIWIRPFALAQRNQNSAMTGIKWSIVRPSQSKIQYVFEDQNFALIPASQFNALSELQKRQIMLFPRILLIDQEKLRIQCDSLKLSNEFLRHVSLKIHDPQFLNELENQLLLNMYSQKN